MCDNECIAYSWISDAVNSFSGTVSTVARCSGHYSFRINVPVVVPCDLSYSRRNSQEMCSGCNLRTQQISCGATVSLVIVVAGRVPFYVDLQYCNIRIKIISQNNN